MTVYGYACVSTTGQTLATQKAMLKAVGVERIFTEKVSGVAAKRPELERALDELEAGDVRFLQGLYVGRSKAQFRQQLVRQPTDRRSARPCERTTRTHQT
jgi:Resolvase, N terminal domain